MDIHGPPGLLESNSDHDLPNHCLFDFIHVSLNHPNSSARIGQHLGTVEMHRVFVSFPGGSYLDE